MAKTQPRGGQILDGSIKLDDPEKDVTGVLPVENGGTGKATIANGSLLVGNGTSAMTEVAPGAVGQGLVSTGSSWASADIMQEELALAYSIAL